MLTGQHDGMAGDAGAGADEGGHERNLAVLPLAVAVGVDASKGADDGALADTDAAAVVQQGALADSDPVADR